MDKKEFDIAWKLPVNKIGKLTLFVAIAFSFLPLLFLYFVYGVRPDFGTALKAWGMIATIFGAMYIVEPISFYSILGLSGTYMSFLSGNIGNCRLPCAAMALEITETEPGTHEAEVVSTLGIAGSIIVNIAGVTLCAFIGAAVINVLPAPVVLGLKSFTAPAIFGAMFGQFAMKYPRLAIFGLGIPVAIRLIAPTTPAYFIIIPAVFGTIIVARLFHIMDQKKAAGGVNK